MRLIAALAIVATLTAARADAQPAPWQPERLTAGWTFTPAMVFGTLWDTNVTVRQEGDPHVQQWVGLLNPRGELDFNGRRTHMNVGYSGALSAYRNLPELDRYEQHGRFEVRHQMRERLSVFSRATGEVAPTTDRLEIGPTVLPFVQVGTTVFNAMGGAHFAMSPYTSLEAQYRFEDVRFDRNEAVNQFLRGGHSNVWSLGLMHAVSSRVSLGGSYEYRHASL